MRCVPTESFDVVNAACPFDRGTVPSVTGLALGFARSLKVTLPVAADWYTVALKVIGTPAPAGFRLVAMMPVAMFFTTWLTDAEVLPAKFASPLYTAVMVWAPVVEKEIYALAEPF